MSANDLAVVSCAQVTQCIQRCPPERLAPCTVACAGPLTPSARPFFDALQACSQPACGAVCASPMALGCRLCVMQHCATQVGGCLAH